MGKNKLKKFADMATYHCVFQFPWNVLDSGECPMRGKWRSDYFHNDNPLVLELGCGKGEYAVGLGQRFPHKNYIGVDIKGARMWTGAKMVEEQGMPNVAFLRTSIEIIDRMFAPGEVSEIWITFPDPQMRKVNKRLTSTRFLANYRKILTDGGIVHLKTDSPFLYTYTHALVELNGLPVDIDTADLYHSGLADDIHPTSRSRTTPTAATTAAISRCPNTCSRVTPRPLTIDTLLNVTLYSQLLQ